MYEPIRTKSVHTMADPDIPQRSREEELDIRLAGHLTALLTVTDELRALTPDEDLDEAAQRIAALVAHLRGREPLRAAPSGSNTTPEHLTALHQRAHMLAGNALVIATSRENEAAMTLTAERMEAHASAMGLTATA